MFLKTQLILFVFLLFLFSSYSLVNAQFQPIPFSGNSPDSYMCADGSTPTKRDDLDGFFYCENGNRATLRPPTLQQFEILFKRIVYVIWAVVASLSFLMLVYLGYRYMLRGGTSDEALVKLKKDILNFAIGFALVFLAIPILTTIFNLLNINTDVSCYDVDMPGFQFFFPELCTDPTGEFYENPIALLRRLIENKRRSNPDIPISQALLESVKEVERTVCNPEQFTDRKTDVIRIEPLRTCINIFISCNRDTRTWDIGTQIVSPCVL